MNSPRLSYKFDSIWRLTREWIPQQCGNFAGRKNPLVW